MAMLEESLRLRVIPRGARNYRAYAELAAGYEERVWESNGTRNRVERLPSGPAVVITPWNAPFMLSTWKTAPALAAGCTVILKPAEWSPLSCSLLADLVDEAELPPGVFNIVQGIGEEIGAALVPIRVCAACRSRARPRPRATSASPPRATSCRSRPNSAARARSSCSPMPTSRPPRRRRRGSTTMAGQVCLAGTRILVEESIARAVHRGLRPLRRRPRPGRLARPGHDRQPAHPPRPPRARRGLRRARPRRRRPRSCAAASATRRTGCGTSRRSIEPASNECEMVQHEVFGPVLTLQSFSGRGRRDPAGEQRPSTGWRRRSGPVREERAEHVGRASEPGRCGSTCSSYAISPRRSVVSVSAGIGREGGDYALDFYSDLKTLQILDGTDALMADSSTHGRRQPAPPARRARPDRGGAVRPLGCRAGRPSRRSRPGAATRAWRRCGTSRQRSESSRPI